MRDVRILIQREIISFAECYLNSYISFIVTRFTGKSCSRRCQYTRQCTFCKKKIRTKGTITISVLPDINPMSFILQLFCAIVKVISSILLNPRRGLWKGFVLKKIIWKLIPEQGER
ncbi:unnamed protein product [Moneuplotes crassus]|uniref:Uncharacterized protein n=1 Tax=Euplotes crassus TaxID=5936 RepID=A0AAD1X6Y6_EUPCR|nr:unnamed protein product [Moneuplotes crassus]